MESDREEGKKNTNARSFWYDNHGSDWEKIVDMDTRMLLDFAQENKAFFHRPISELTVPTLPTGSKQDEFCHDLDKIYSDLKQKNKRLEMYLFEKGGHPAMLSNSQLFFEKAKQEILDPGIK